MDELIDRIYLVRCQLVHGAATYPSKLNRETVGQCGYMLDKLLFVVVTIIADYGTTSCWENLCYPPVRDERTNQTEKTQNKKPR